MLAKPISLRELKNFRICSDFISEGSFILYSDINLKKDDKSLLYDDVVFSERFFSSFKIVRYSLIKTFIKRYFSKIQITILRVLDMIFRNI